MIFSFFKRRKPEQGIEPLYGAIMAAALDPVLYAKMGVPDTFEGRFESAGLHVALVLMRLKRLAAPADQAAQELVDRFFDGLDSAMREKGVSDVGVPKRIKKFAQGFYGRLAVYTEALQPDAPAVHLTEALERNLLNGAEASPELANYVRRLTKRLETTPFETLIVGDRAVFMAEQPGDLT